MKFILISISIFLDLHYQSITGKEVRAAKFKVSQLLLYDSDHISTSWFPNFFYMTLIISLQDYSEL